jgi:hypothetical protein
MIKAREINHVALRIGGTERSRVLSSGPRLKAVTICGSILSRRGNFSRRWQPRRAELYVPLTENGPD